MADTWQSVIWAIQRKCPFRHGSEWFLPRHTHSQLATLQTVSRAEADNRVFHGICITSQTSHSVPASGFRIDEKLSNYGGQSRARATCGQCEANAASQPEIGLAGCCGHLHLLPDSQELNEALWWVIHNRDLEQTVFAVFPQTTPLWYGLWINSPLQKTQIELLHELLGHAFAEMQQSQDKNWFLLALKAAAKWNLPLHVSLLPPGHVDFGWHTVFPHCPRCKAETSIDRWQESYPKDPYVCNVCGQVFLPDDYQYQKCEPHIADWNADSLEPQMGTDEYWEFVRRFLLHRGRPSIRVDEIITRHRSGKGI